MREKYESLSLVVLKDLAKARGIKITSGMKKADVVEAMLAKDEEEKAGAVSEPATENVEAVSDETTKKAEKKAPAKKTSAKAKKSETK